jgi:hypothetical protein
MAAAAFYTCKTANLMKQTPAGNPTHPIFADYSETGYEQD